MDADATHPHPAMEREVGEAHAHPLLMLDADNLLVGFREVVSHAGDDAESVHAVGRGERGERVERDAERVVRVDGGGFAGGGGFAHGEDVIGRGAGLTQAFSNRPLHTRARRIRSGRGCRSDTSASSSRGTTDRFGRGRCRSRPLGSSSAYRFRSCRRGCRRVLFRGLGICSWWGEIDASD